MTREVRKLGAKVTIVEPPALRRMIRDPPDVALKAPRPNRYVNTEAISPSIQRSNRDLLGTKEAPKPLKKQKVSIAGVFKKPQKVKTGRISKKKQNHREGTPELDLIGDLQDGIHAARTHLSSTAKVAFTSIHDAFNTKLEAINDEDTVFLQHVSNLAAILGTPLLEEKIETEIRKDGKRVVEVVEIGKRVKAFKVLIESEEAKLMQAWKEWDEVQEEYIELGIEVFGGELFNANEAGGGFKKDIELLELEHSTRVGELEEEIDESRAEALQQMEVSEKKLGAATRREQQQLLQDLL